MDRFADAIFSSHRLDEVNIDELANRWRDLMSKTGSD
jgi:hypothetical protein